MTVTRPALGKLYPLAKGLRGNQRRDAKKHWVSSGHSRDPADVRFTPESGHVRCNSRCLLRAKSGHIAAYSRSVSARVINEFGNVIPSDLATFRLRANSNRVGRSIGKSVGRAPLRILSMNPATRRISSLVLGP